MRLGRHRRAEPRHGGALVPFEPMPAGRRHVRAHLQAAVDLDAAPRAPPTGASMTAGPVEDDAVGAGASQEVATPEGSRRVNVTWLTPLSPPSLTAL